MGALAEAKTKARIQSLQDIVEAKDAEIKRLEVENKYLHSHLDERLHKAKDGWVMVESKARLLADQKRRIVEAVQNVWQPHGHPYEYCAREHVIAAIDKACEGK